MRFDLDKEIGYFEEDEDQGIAERLALGFPLDITYIHLNDLYKCLRRRQHEIQQALHERHNPDYRAHSIIQMIDEHLQSTRPDLYLK